MRYGGSGKRQSERAMLGRKLFFFLPSTLSSLFASSLSSSPLSLSLYLYLYLYLYL